MGADKLPAQFGNYLLLKALGRGAAGDVFLARPIDPNSQIPTPVVVKRLHGELQSNKTFVRRFKHEADIAFSIDDPHIAKVYDAGSVGETLYLVMEYVEGWPLSRVIRDVVESDGQVSLPSIRDIMEGALAGLVALHTAKDSAGDALGIIHRDLAPKNIMVGEDGRTRLIDLGLGRSRLQDWKTRTGTVLGTPGYMSPEQVRADDVDHRTDIYSLAIVLWELITLQPFVQRGTIHEMLRASLRPTITPPSTLRPGTPTILDEITRKGLAPLPQDRFQSAQEFLDALRSAIPDRSAGDDMKTLLGQLLWSELGQSRTEVTNLVRAAMPREVSTQEANIVQFQTTPTYNNVAPTLHRTPPLEPTAVRPQAHDAVAHPPPPDPHWTTGRILQYVAFAAALPLTFAAGLYYAQPDTVIEVQAVTPIPVPEGPGAVGAKKPIPAPVPEAPATEPAQPEPESPTKVETAARPSKAPATTRPKKVKPKTPTPPPTETAEATPSPAELKTRVSALIARAKSMKRDLSGQASEQEVADVLNKLIFERRAPDAKRVKALSRRLDAVQKQ